MIQVCSIFHWARVFIINTRPDEIDESGGGSSGIFSAFFRAVPVKSETTFLKHNFRCSALGHALQS